jgi:hypothetical protein
MKKYINIIMGIIIGLVTTALIELTIYFTNPSFSAAFLICCISGVGYTISYLFITNNLN